MSTPVVVDSSVAVKWFTEPSERGAAEAFALLDKHRDRELMLVAPTHLRLEVLNALRFSGLTADERMAVSRDLEDFGLEWVETSAGVASEAAGVALAHSLTIYDAVFVAVALALDAELVTADRAILRAEACRLRALADSSRLAHPYLTRVNTAYWLSRSTSRKSSAIVSSNASSTLRSSAG